MRFLASRKLSLFCFFLNCIFAFSAFINGDFLWLVLSVAFALLCLYNYQNTED